MYGSAKMVYVPCGSTISSFVGQLDLGAALEQSKAAGSSLVEAFTSQGEKVVEFGRKVNALVKQGLERPAWSAIMALGYERGTEVADKLAEGNVAGNIANVNKVYESVKTMGDEVAELAKQKFYDVGMQTMVTTLEAMIEQSPAARDAMEAAKRAVLDGQTPPSAASEMVVSAWLREVRTAGLGHLGG